MEFGNQRLFTLAARRDNTNQYYEHFKTITKHKLYVAKACFACGLYTQGITHDFSKYGPTEFFASARHFQGNRSPIDAEKDAHGYSLAWQNHKAKNKHHWQYWTDFENGSVLAVTMPQKYIAEMLCDWIGAGKAYNRGSWTVKSFKTWYEKNKSNLLLSDSVRAQIEYVVAIVQNYPHLCALIRLIAKNKLQIDNDIEV